MARVKCNSSTSAHLDVISGDLYMPIYLEELCMFMNFTQKLMGLTASRRGPHDVQQDLLLRGNTIRGIERRSWRAETH